MVFSKYDGDTIDGVLNGDSAFRTELSSAFDAAGFHYLGILQNATYRLTTANKELNTLADFKALQIRTMNNSNHMAFWTAIGAEPTPLAWSEVYFALQSGTICLLYTSCLQVSCSSACWSAQEWRLPHHVS